METPLLRVLGTTPFGFGTVHQQKKLLYSRGMKIMSCASPSAQMETPLLQHLMTIPSGFGTALL